MVHESEFLGKFSEINSLLVEKYLRTLDFLAKNDQPESAIEEFFSSVRKYASLIYAQMETTSFELDLRTAFAASKHHSENRLEFLPLYHARYGGSYVLFYAGPSIEDAFLLTIAKLKLAHPNISVEFSSETDAVEDFFPKLDQSVEEGIISEFSAKGHYVVREKLSGARTIVRYDERDFGREDMILDTIGRKIYVRGERISSKEVPTQQATIELLSAFFGGRNEINVSELPRSSYTASRSDMTSKLIVPIKKLTKRIFGEELNIVCR